MENKTPGSRAQIVYLSHGGGPLPLLGDEGHKAMVAFMQRLPEQLHKPDLILVISAHWEESVATLLAAENPVMFYDYYGFPAQAYEFQYPAPGSPIDAKRIVELLEKNQVHAKLDLQRGFDHGVFIPLKLMYPEADIPCLQLSLIAGLNPSTHIGLGKALRELNNENILVIGSGFSFHNMRAFSWESKVEPDPGNDAFQNWLIETCTADLTQAEREKRLVEWAKAPAARYCHPREEHLLPLHVCQGMSDKPAKLIFDDLILGKRGVAFKW
ncbi:MAG TPA: dioxygenase [Anaerolineaceae bacterium]|nr:dioxygenase [Anaerolineaceae bacterium]